MNGENRARDHYQGLEGLAYQEGKRSVPSATYPWVARLRAEKFARLIRKEDVVLEYGVGLGWNLAFLNCRRKLGYDVGTFLGEGLAERNIEFIKDTRTLAAGSINVVICHHTLEHCLAPGEELEEMFRLLPSQGRLVLVVPYERERSLRHYRPGDARRHLYAWTVQSLGNLVSATGFEVVETAIRLYGYERIAAIWATRLRWSERGFRFMNKIGRLLFPIWEIQLLARKSEEAGR